MTSTASRAPSSLAPPGLSVEADLRIEASAPLDLGLFHLLAPAAFGGSEVAVRTAFEVFEEVSRADGATGWSLMAGAIYLAVAAGYLPDEGARAIFADRRAVAAGQVAPLGTATRNDDGRGWTVEGRFG